MMTRGLCRCLLTFSVTGLGVEALWLCSVIWVVHMISRQHRQAHRRIRDMY